MTRVPIFQIRADGSDTPLGEWVHEEHRLVLSRPGFPLFPPGEHVLGSELPWVFWDMCPTGYMGRSFFRRVHELALPPDPQLWSARDALRALSHFGQDLSGNLIVGDASLARWHGLRQSRQQLPPRAAVTSERMTAIVDEHLAQLEGPPGGNAAPSSLGGERPKFIQWNPDGADELVKFSPPRSTLLGQRWWDLLHVEELCSAVLRAHGYCAVEARTERAGERALLFVRRFDRRPGFGRRGATTLYWYAMERLGDPAVSAPQVVDVLVADGHLASDDGTTVAQVHEFSAAIGNNDAHLGNYGLVFDDDGATELAPFFDILPMALAPRNDELPDSRLVPLKTQRRHLPMVDDLIARVVAQPHVSREFVTTWLQYLGR